LGQRDALGYLYELGRFLWQKLRKRFNMSYWTYENVAGIDLMKTHECDAFIISIDCTANRIPINDPTEDARAGR
jgi:hypothetical protein